MNGMSEEESNIFELLVEAWNAYTKLSVQRFGDSTEFCNAIHQCQRLLMIRQVRDNYPEFYNNEQSGCVD